ncbi:sugar/nucleoside kinase (ribokinase family) [Dyadobacter sp. BE34]|uniref:Sugar/nucleoside kinase (Ribokinase family) n=1 Tax=Dyadobacter fermentans TaxID=94254 RepID=A0ABU1R8Y3_9BACT|nr:MULTISPECIES: PfkB family carbohydrate kinase [Dyadobacter]MDR6809349.1 sugar/nucleoside kinase (ribokinase family) [Dyadobacter fermentans]MDR7047057.1 sugar/nucleoside kinase (ribokinase family) [Dyadobacter sp. BE242]MDR7194976.1 sugar/nucleoside kinase (ribokinase family) [Dyadobacter sp. BE34]MDR7214479.1 sugar/nucleoside kinase (ribokinase family) [Dyadobacter sp. BE31]MDR7266898.1 sugar/nucleoside kinase (ribokinase family) [Dyadobacter sp. BE32]
MSLLTVGSVAFDALETPFGKTDKIIGGAATYITLAASYFTQQNNLVAVVGGDFPKEMIDLLEEHGVDTKGLEIVQDGKTFFWSGKYHEDMNTRDTLITELNVMEHFDPIIPDSYQGTEFLMLGNTVPATQKLVIERLAKRPKLIMLDTMNLWMNIALDDLKSVLKLVDLLTINDEEARLLSGEYSLRKAAKKIMAMGPKTLIIKKGEHGALLFQEDRIFFAPALPLEEVFDPTGAGDSFAGGFIGYLAATDDISFENMKRAIIYGSAMASFCVEKFGTERLVNLSKDEINARVQEFVKLASFEIQ